MGDQFFFIDTWCLDQWVTKFNHHGKARQDEFQKQIQSMKPTQKYMLMGFEVQTCFVFFLGNSN